VAAVVLGQERGDEGVLDAAGHDGAQRRVDVERARRLALALAPALLDEGRRDERGLAPLRAVTVRMGSWTPCPLRASPAWVTGTMNGSAASMT
jgi:hypothetical protein